MTEVDRQASFLNKVLWDVFYELFDRRPPKAKLFGSRKYGLSGAGSDFDFALELPEDLQQWAKVVRASVRQKLIDGLVTTFSKSSDELSNETLKWTVSKEKKKVSLRVLSTSQFDNAVAVTEYLEEFYSAHKDMKPTVMAVAECLREAKLMGGRYVGDGLKSAPLSA